MICITLSVHVLSDFIRFHSSSEATRSFFIVGESWWVMLVSHVLPPLTPYSLARLKQQYIHNWWKESERYCQEHVRTHLPSVTERTLFSHPSWDPIFNRFCCASSAHLRFSTITFLSSYASAFSVFSRSSARAWRSRIVRPDMTGLITRRKDEDHQGLVQHLKRFKGRETKRW